MVGASILVVSLESQKGKRDSPKDGFLVLECKRRIYHGFAHCVKEGLDLAMSIENDKTGRSGGHFG